MSSPPRSSPPHASLLPQEIIRKKRDGGTLSAQEIDTIIGGLTVGKVSEGQAAAFAMAVFFRGMTRDERVALTHAMTHSGSVLAWDLPGPVLDKHSTGGVGDTVSLALAPMVAACGGYVPMISGRGLGHTGGTLDKLDSIAGYVSQPDSEHFARVVREAGCAIIGQTTDLAPADKRLYAIRDVTATVESIPLLTSSILSKKLAAGLDGLVMDVKAGNGAFMPTDEGSLALARAIVDVANHGGLPATALITAMDQPLGSTAGNALEAAYAIDYLKGLRREPRFHTVTVALAAEMLILGGLAPDIARATALIEDSLASGAAAERFARMVAALGGPADLMERPADHLPRAPIVRPVHASRSGRVSAIDTRAVGIAVVALGGGRTRPEDDIDHAVGLTALAAIGDTIDMGGRPLAIVHARDEAAAAAAARAVERAYAIGEGGGHAAPVIQRRLTRDDLGEEDDGA